MFTTPHRAVRPNGNQPAQPASAEWQAPPSGPLNGQSGQMGAVRSPGFPERKGDTLQSLAALKKAGSAAPVSSAFSPPSAPSVSNAPFVDPRGGQNGASQVASSPFAPEVGEVVRPEDKASVQSKRNYPALAAALQTIGYSVGGFIASAVVSLDGTPIAQVAVDEIDISPLCAYLSSIVQGAVRTTEPERGGSWEHIVITSSTQHILLRVLSRKKDVFQVLITTREAAPAESLDVLANVEVALTAAL